MSFSLLKLPFFYSHYKHLNQYLLLNINSSKKNIVNNKLIFLVKTNLQLKLIKLILSCGETLNIYNLII